MAEAVVNALQLVKVLYPKCNTEARHGGLLVRPGGAPYPAWHSSSDDDGQLCAANPVKRGCFRRRPTVGPPNRHLHVGAGPSGGRPPGEKAGTSALVPHPGDRLAGSVQVSDDLVPSDEGDADREDVDDAELRDSRGRGLEVPAARALRARPAGASPGPALDNATTRTGGPTGGARAPSSLAAGSSPERDHPAPTTTDRAPTPSRSILLLRSSLAESLIYDDPGPTGVGQPCRLAAKAVGR